MKSFAIYWARLLASNEKLETADTIKLTLEEFRKQLKRAWHDGQKLTSDGEMFDLLFGGRKG